MAARDPLEDPDYLFRDLGGSSGDDDDENLFLARRIREIADGIQLFSPRNVGGRKSLSNDEPRASEETLDRPVWDAATGLVWDDAATEAVASLEADLDALRRDVASLGRPLPAKRPTWLLAAATGLALTAWVLTPEDPYAAALAS